MTRDAEMRARDWTDLVLANIGQETDAWAVTRIPSSTALAVNFYSDPAHRAELKRDLGVGTARAAARRRAGQRPPADLRPVVRRCRPHDAALDDLIHLLDGSFTVEGLAIDQDMRWTLSPRSRSRVASATPRSTPSSRSTGPSRARSWPRRPARRSPTREAKEAAWAAIIDPATPNETAREIAFSIFRLRPGGRARALPREVPHGRGDAGRRARFPQGLDGARVRLPQAARLGGDPRSSRRVARRQQRAQAGPALPRGGPRRRRPRAQRPGVRRADRVGHCAPSSSRRCAHVVVQVCRQARFSRAVRRHSRAQARCRPGAGRVFCGRACSASIEMPRCRPESRSPEENSDDIASTASSTSASVR